MGEWDTKPLAKVPLPRSHHWLKIFMAIGGAIVVVGGTLGWLGWRELQKRLPAIISEELSGALGRPIVLGELQRFSLTGLRFGGTILPPTSNNFTWARVQITDISLNPLDLILRRTFRPNLLLIRPEVAIKQRFDRQWVLEAPDSADNEGKIKTEIGRIRIRNADVSIGPVSRQNIVKAPEGFSSSQIIRLENVNLSVFFAGDNNEMLSLNVGGRMKQGTFQVRGAGNLDTRETNLTLQGKKLRIDTLNPFLGGSLFLGEGHAYSSLYIEVRPEQDPPVSIEGAARVENGEAAITGLPSNIEDIYGRLQFRGQQVTFDDTDFHFGPIKAEVRGSVSLQNGFQVGVLLPDVSVGQVELALAQPLPVPATGRLAIATRIRGPLRAPRFEGDLTNLTPMTVDRLGINQLTATYSGNADVLSLDDFRLIPSTGGQVTARGQVRFDENLLQARNLPPTALDLTADADIPLAPIAQLYDVTLPVALGRLTAIANVSGPLSAPIGTATWQLQEGIAVGSGVVSYAEAIATLTNTRLTVADTGDITAAGQVNVATQQLNLTAAARLPLDEIVQQTAIALPAGLLLGTMTANVNAAGPLTHPLAEARWQLAEGSVPGQGSLTYADQRVALRDTTFDVGGGSLTAVGQADLRAGFWDVGVVGNRLGLGVVSPQLWGTADLALQASGSLTDLSPAGIRAGGDLAFSDGIPLSLTGADILDQGPLALTFDWDGIVLGIPALSAPGLAASGQIATLPDPQTGFPYPSFFDFTARLSDFDLARLNPLLPTANYGVLLQGWFDFDGTFRGDLDNPRLQGDIAFRETGIGNLRLLSDVRGPIDISPQGGARLDLVGDLTEIRAEVDAERLPVSLLFRNGPLFVTAQREGDWLRGRVRDFPIEALGLRPIPEPDLGVMGGILRSDFEVQLSTLFTNPTARVSFGVNRPALGQLAASSLQGGLRLANWQARLENTFLELPQSRIDVAATADLRSPRTATARITTRDAHIEDLLAALRLYEIADVRNFLEPRAWGTAADLQTTPIETPPGDLAAQMQQAAIARALQDQREEDAERALLPSLSELRGTFSADIDLAASETAGMTMAFDVNGADWSWGPYAFANQFVARGALQDEVLTLAPVRLEAGEALVNLEGQLGLDGLDTQLQIAHIDLAPIARVLDLPLPLAGEINAIADLTGSPANPALLGTLTIDEAVLNHYPLTIGSNFSYQDAWFRFDARVQGEPAEPLLVQGQVPFALPFMTVQPDRDALLVQATLASEGFALLDMFRPYVAWGGGDANLAVEARGSLSRPEIKGEIAFQSASITSEFLQESLTDLTGTIGLVGDRLQVSGLQGTLLDGQFFLVGELPFLTATAQTAPPIQPLTLSLNTLQFNFADEVTSQIDGEVIVGNALQSPIIGGGIQLGGIRVNVGRQSLGLANTLLVDPGVEAVVAGFDATLDRFKDLPGAFENFQITLTDPAIVRVYPLLNIAAIGEISLSGPLVLPSGEGNIELLEGWVNTVTTTLDLVTSDRRNLITFTPEDGLNPYVSLLFQGRLPLQRNLNLESNPTFAVGNTSEVPDLDPLAGLTLFDEILIQAAIEGYGSQGFDLLSLTSTPNYSQERLLSMLSGGYLTDLPNSEPALVLASNLVSAFFTDQQQALGSALGLRNLRIQPATVLPGNDSDTLGVGIGINAGITDSLSAGIVQVLDKNQPFQLNLQYRINNELGIGSSTNFTDESRIFLQYRINF